MKKMILFLIIVIMGFSANFTGDKRYHEKQLVGIYHGKYENIVVKSENKKLKFYYNDGSSGYFKPVGDGLYVAEYTINTNYHGYGTMSLYFAYDIKLKTLVQVGEGNEIIEVYRKIK